MTGYNDSTMFSTLEGASSLARESIVEFFSPAYMSNWTAPNLFIGRCDV